MTTLTRFSKYRDKPAKFVREIEKACREEGLECDSRQNGTSHKVITIHNGKQVQGMVVAQHGEIPKGTFKAILKALAAIGLAVFIIWLKGLGI